ncbi:reverse transcriptase domain-containing protein [Tanacetum coccineum]
MTNGRETTPPPGFLTPPHIPNINTTERPPVTTIVFAATNPENTPFAYRASTSTDLAPMISPAFVEANHEILESLLRYRRRQIRNEDLQTKLEVSRQREKGVGFEENFSETGRSRIGRNVKGNGPSEAGAEENGRWEMNLPSLLVAHLGRSEDGQPPRSSLTSVGEKKEKSTTPSEAPILMINQEEACTRNNVSKSPTFEGREITFHPVTKGRNSSALVIIKAKIFGREVGRVHMDSGSSCEVIYEHCFLKLKPSIQASKVDSRVSLVGFLGEKSWAIGEVLLDITIGNALLTRSKTLNFIIVRSNSPYNMLLGRTTMKKMGMVVSMIHGAVKFHTTQGIRTVFSTHESGRIEGVKKVRETSPSNIEWVLSCINAEEKIIVNNKYPEQTITIGKQLPEHFKERLQNLLRTNVDVFAWTHDDMTGIPRTITVNGKPFNTEHKLNEYSHIKPIK